MGFSLVSAQYPTPRLGLALQACPCSVTNYYDINVYSYHTNVGTYLLHKLATSMPLCLLPHHMDPAMCVRVLKNTQYGEMNPNPPSGTHIAQPLNPCRVSLGYQINTEQMQHYFLYLYIICISFSLL